MSLYFDSSALVKLALGEEETTALKAWLGERRVCTNLVGRVEFERAVRRREPERGELNIRRVLDRVDVIGLNVATAAVAAVLAPPVMRSLDALHLASARQLGDELEAFVCYDGRLAAAATAAGFTVAQPH